MRSHHCTDFSNLAVQCDRGWRYHNNHIYSIWIVREWDQSVGLDCGTMELLRLTRRIVFLSGFMYIVNLPISTINVRWSKNLVFIWPSSSVCGQSQWSFTEIHKCHSTKIPLYCWSAAERLPQQLMHLLLIYMGVCWYDLRFFRFQTNLAETFENAFEMKNFWNHRQCGQKMQLHIHGDSNSFTFKSCDKVRRKLLGKKSSAVHTSL